MEVTGATYTSAVSKSSGLIEGRKSTRIPLSNEATLSSTWTSPLFVVAGRKAMRSLPGTSMCSYHCDFFSAPVEVYWVLFWRKLMVFRNFPSYRSCIALSNPPLVANLKPAPGPREDDDLTFGDAAGSVAAPDWKYEQPTTAKAARRIPERII